MRGWPGIGCSLSGRLTRDIAVAMHGYRVASGRGHQGESICLLRQVGSAA